MPASAAAVFADRLQELLLEHDMNYAGLARSLHVAKSTTIEWREKMPRAEYLLAVAELFDVSVDWLLGRPDAVKWSPLLQAHRSQLRLHLANQSDCRDMTPSQRLAYALAVWREIDQRPDRDRLLAARLGVSTVVLEHLQTAAMQVEEGVLRRFSLLTGVPYRWFLTGELDELSAEGLREFVPAILGFQAAGVTAEELTANATILIKMIEHMRTL